MPIKNQEANLVIFSEGFENLNEDHLVSDQNLNLQSDEENSMDPYISLIRDNSSSFLKNNTNVTSDLTDFIFPNSRLESKLKDINMENLKIHTFELYQLNLKKKEIKNDKLAFRDFTEIEHLDRFKDSTLIKKYNSLFSEESYRTSYINSHMDISSMNNEALISLAEQSKMLVTRILAFVKTDEFFFTSLLRYLRVLYDPASITDFDVFVDTKSYFKQALFSCYNLLLYSSPFVAYTIFQDNNVDLSRFKYATIAMALIKILHNTNLSVGIAKTETSYFLKNLGHSFELKYYISKFSNYMLSQISIFFKASLKNMSPFVKQSCLFVMQSTSLAICGYLIHENSNNTLIVFSQKPNTLFNSVSASDYGDWFDKFIKIVFFSFSNI